MIATMIVIDRIDRIDRLQHRKVMTHTRRHALPFDWPAVPFRVVLVEPKIPPNTGNIARLCAATGCELHLVEPLGFRLTDAQVRRAGLDYWDAVEPIRHAGLDAFFEAHGDAPFYLFSTAGTTSYFDADYAPGTALIFGSETEGLSDKVLSAHPDRVLGIPMRTDRVRSLNLANAASIAVYEALRTLRNHS